MSGASQTELEAKVLEVLSSIQDPDLGRDIVTLGFIKNLELKRGLLGTEVRFEIELTTPACPIKDEFKRRAKMLVEDIPGVTKAEVTMTARVRAQASAKRVPGVRNVIAVGSGKGGVGKSTVAVNLAYALKLSGAKVGLLDADVYGPSIAMMLGLADGPKVKNNFIQPVEAFGLPTMTFAFFAPVGEAVLWRGPMVGKAVEQMLFEVDWTASAGGPQELDYLVVDLPPGTGDVHLSLVHSVDLAGAVLVSTPQDVALIDTVRGLAMFEKLKVPILGLVENMSGFTCAHCHKITDIFGSGGAEAKANERGIPFLGRIPLDPELVRRGDGGTPLLVSQPDHPVSLAFVEAAKQLAHRLSLVNMKGAAL